MERPKKITNKEDMKKHIYSAMKRITDIVATTLGPGGLPVIIERVGQQLDGSPLGPMQTKDGVSVAVECSDPDPDKNAVIQAVKNICIKTNRVAGDGTTTAIVLGNAILREAIKYSEENNINPQVVRRSLEEATRQVREMLVDKAVPCKDYSMMEYVATVSANGDKTIGSLIRKAFEAVGAEGVVTVDYGNGAHHTLDVVNGFQIKRGAEGQSRFFNDTAQTKFQAENVSVLLYDGALQSSSQVLNLLNVIHKNNPENMPPVLLIANEFSQEVIQYLLINRAEFNLSVCAVKGPHVTNVRTAMYDDLAVFLGGTRLGNGNRNLNNLEYDDLGLVDKVVVDKYVTTFYGGQGNEELVLERVDQLKQQKLAAESDYDLALLSERISGLSEGIAKIGVGGHTDFELKEVYHRIEDAVNASRAAIEMGVIPGGGSTLYRLSKELPVDTIGQRILKEALKAPLRQIMENLGIDVTTQDLIATQLKEGLVYEGNSEEVVDALEAGIIDPAKVTITALENAVSIAALLSTCGGAITYDRD